MNEFILPGAILSFLFLFMLSSLIMRRKAMIRYKAVVEESLSLTRQNVDQQQQMIALLGEIRDILQKSHKHSND